MSATIERGRLGAAASGAPAIARRRRLASHPAFEWWPVPVAAAGGLLNALAFPPVGWWGLAFVGTPLLLGAAASGRFRVVLAAGVVGGAVFWGTLTSWLTVYLGPAPWLALTALEAGIFGPGMLTIWFAWRAIHLTIRPPGMRLIVAPPLIGGLWVLQETVAGSWPYGGFSWAALAYSQATSPMAELAAWIGTSGLSFVIAALAALLVEMLRSGVIRDPRWAVLPFAIALGLAAAPPFPIAEQGSMRIGAVQGNSEAGLLAENAPDRILTDHLRASEPILDRDMDLLVWPENASDLNPVTSRAAAGALDDLSETVSAPLVVGTITQNGDDQFNSLLLWDAGSGATAQYDKKRPVPFAEYLPDRAFWYPLAPDLFDLIPRDLSIGTRQNVFEVDDVPVGLAICFDIVDQGLVRDMVAGGAQVILVPSNNADFGRTGQSEQQLAIARIRAIEAGRAVVNISTVAGSAMVGPGGATINALESFSPGAMVDEVPLSTTITPAMAFGVTLQALILTGSVGSLVACAVVAGRRRWPFSRGGRAGASGRRRFRCR